MEISFRVSAVVFEYSGSTSEDEVSRTLNVTVLEVLARTFTGSVDRVLISDEAAVLEHSSVAPHVQRHSCPARPALLCTSGHVHRSLFFDI
jgi:hypothetical protein